MNYYFAVCSTERYHQKYLEFLLEHYTQLNLPYSFPVSLSFIGSPVLLERQSFLCFNEEYEVIGALGYIHGTGENQYQDDHIVQIQTVFFVEEHRKTDMFIKGLQYLTQYIAQLNREVTELRFWTPTDDYLRRLFVKIAERTNSLNTSFGPIDEYRALFPAWHTYAHQFRHETYF